MSRMNGTRHETAFTVSIEAKRGGHHRHLGGRPCADDRGSDRCRPRERTKSSPPAMSSRWWREPGGVLVRAGHTEAAVDVSRLAGLNPSGVICEIMKEDGTMARLDDLVILCTAAQPQDRHDPRPDRLSPPPRPSGREGRRARPSCRITAATGSCWSTATSIDGGEHRVLRKGRVRAGRADAGTRPCGLAARRRARASRGPASAFSSALWSRSARAGAGDDRAARPPRPIRAPADRRRRHRPRHGPQELWHRCTDPGRPRHPRHDPAHHGAPQHRRPGSATASTSSASGRSRRNEVG